jgi:hypothetical protein
VIVIFSIESDLSTDRVCDWLDTYDAEYVRLHPESTLYSALHFDMQDSLLYVQDKRIEIDNVRCVWLRKWNYLNGFEKSVTSTLTLMSTLMTHEERRCQNCRTSF